MGRHYSFVFSLFSHWIKFHKFKIICEICKNLVAGNERLNGLALLNVYNSTSYIPSTAQPREEFLKKWEEFELREEGRIF